MKGLGFRLAIIVLLALLSGAYILPWKTIGIDTPFPVTEYKLGLDLHGGVELDYKIDMTDAQKNGSTFQPKDIIEGLKSIVEKRVNSLGTAEPTIQTASYGGEEHIIVQIPTQNFDGENLTAEEKKAKNDEYIAKAKETIGKVVRLEFKEQKTVITDADKKERTDIANNLLAEIQAAKYPFATIANKYKDQYENIEYRAGSGAASEIPGEFAFTGMENVQAPYTSPKIMDTQKGAGYTLGTDNKLVTTEGEKGYSIVRIKSTTSVEKERDVTTGTGASAVTKKEKYTEKIYDYEGVFVSQKPSEWTPAKTADGKVLDEQYLTKASVSFSQGFSPQVDLLFNADGGKIFAELTKRLIGKQIAIFVGGEMLTAPTVQSVIPDGRAVITGNYTADSAKALATNINTGIVPAPIYLTSERTIDAKIGADSLKVIIHAGLIGLLLIIGFLILIYRVSGLMAGVALVIYGLLLLAIVKSFGIVLTLASIAGIILSIGLAIDANILIFERTKEELRKGVEIEKAIIVGFGKSWSAIWDSHITSFTSAIVLYIFGISLIKGFGLMLGLGILLSLFTAMWISRILILVVGNKMRKNTKTFIGV
ncbi:MAG: protein translocase subunit SecD [Candidatus Gracilibacteria bacterium]|nr:protein translocase subunit SecD [Candidatus Gracilibacteria bacterium]